MKRSSVFGSIRDKLRGDSDKNSEKRDSDKPLASNNPFADPSELSPTTLRNGIRKAEMSDKIRNA